MTRIVALEVDWMEGYANNPEFVVTLDSWPGAVPEDAPVWINKDGIHVAVCFDDVVVPYFYSDGKPTNGFAGARFAGTFVDDGTFEYTGAWSSRAGVVRKITNICVVDCSIKNEYRHAGICEVAFLRFFDENRNNLPFGLAYVKDTSGEITIQPTRDGKLKESHGYYTIVRHL